MFNQFTKILEERLPTIRRLSGEGAWILLGQIATMAGSLAMVRVLTEYLEPSKYGEVALGLTLANLVNLVIMGTLSSGVSRFFSIANEKNDLAGYIKSSIKLMFLAILATIFLGLLVILTLLLIEKGQWLWMVIAIITYSSIAGYNSALSSLQNAARQRSIVAFHNGLDAWLKLGFAVLLIVTFGKNSTYVIVGFLFSSLVIGCSQTYCLRRLLSSRNVNLKKSSAKDWRSSMWKYSWPFMIWGVFGWAQQSSTRWALEAFASTEDVGMYSVVSQIGYFPIQTGIGLLMTFLMPILYSRAGDATDNLRRENVDHIIKRVAVTGVIFTVVASIIAAIFHDFIFQLLVAEAYRTVSKYISLMVLAGGIFGIALVISSRFFAFLEPSKLMPASIGSSLIGIFAAFVGTNYFSVFGAVLAMLIHSISYLGLTMITKVEK